MRYPVAVWSGYYRDLHPEQAMDRFISAGFSHMEWATEHTLMRQSRKDGTSGSNLGKGAEFLYAPGPHQFQGRLLR